MIRSLQCVLMIQSISTTLTSKSFLLIASLRSVVSSKIVSFPILHLKVNQGLQLNLDSLRLFYNVKTIGFLTHCTDKKNENKEVAVDEFLPSTTAVEAIQYSM